MKADIIFLLGPPMRETSIVSGVEFLTHPSVLPHSREEKESFLRGKGLTGEEIEEAFKRSDLQQARTGSSPHNNQAPASQPPAHPTQPTIVYAPAPETTTDSWLALMAPASLVLTAGASLAYLYKAFMNSENGSFPWENQTQGLGPPPLVDDHAS